MKYMVLKCEQIAQMEAYHARRPRTFCNWSVHENTTGHTFQTLRKGDPQLNVFCLGKKIMCRCINLLVHIHIQMQSMVDPLTT